MTTMVEMTKEDANNYCRVLTALGMEEEGDPVAEVERLKRTLEGYQAAYHRRYAARREGRTMTTNTDGVSAMSAELERMKAALAQIANMPGHCGHNMRQLAGDALGWQTVYQRDCHACINGSGTHHSLCPEHPKKPLSRRYFFGDGVWLRSNDGVQRRPAPMQRDPQDGQGPSAGTTGSASP